MELIVLICGGRHYSDWHHFKTRLAQFEAKFGKITKIVHGHASGADALADRWGRENNVEVVRYPAEWRHPVTGAMDRSAGPRRNAKMLKENPELFCVLAFPGGRGTENMAKLATEIGKKVYFC